VTLRRTVEGEGRFYITGTPGDRDWVANLRADPHLVVHLKRRAGLDVDARAVPVTDPVTPPPRDARRAGEP
jgi:hypothetical protein